MVWIGLFALCGAIAFAQDAAPQVSGQRTDGQIEMDVVKALDASSALKNDLITAATIQSEVTLSGTVSDQAAKDLAQSIVSHVAGVTKVHNNLEIGNPQQAAQNEQLPTNEETAPEPAPGDQNQGAMQPPAAQPQEPMAGPGPDQGPPQAPAQGPEQGQYPQQYPPPPARPAYPNQYPQNQGQYPQYQNQYPQPYPAQPPAPAYEPAKGPVTVPQGTLLQVRTDEPLDSKKAVDGTPVQFTVIQDVALGGVLAIPRGATVHGVVTESKQAGQLSGSPELALRLTSLDLGGRSYPIDSDLFKVKGPNKAGRTAGNAIGGALIGAIIGGAAGGGGGAAIGAAAGGTVGTAASAATPGPRVWIPAEALVTFHLKAPVTVAPVSPQEAARLAQGLYPGGPTLYRRGYYPYGPYPARFAPYGYYGYAPYGYPYPPVYYRPYYMIGGSYYWR